MNKFTLSLLAFGAMSASAFAQSTKYVFTSGQQLDTSVFTQQAQSFQLGRTLFAGYNTICLPVDLTPAQLQAIAKDVRIEEFTAIRQEGDVLNLYFTDCTDKGLQAGQSYLIYSPTQQYMRIKSSQVSGTGIDIRPTTLSDGQGNKVTFSSSWQAITEDGRYGIPALQDAYVLESVLVRTEGDKTFLPTRCGFTWDAQSTTATTLQIRHITGTEGMETSISRLRAEGTEVDVYDTAGNLILRSTTVSKAQQQLPKGIYVIGGEKFAVK